MTDDNGEHRAGVRRIWLSARRREQRFPARAPGAPSYERNTAIMRVTRHSSFRRVAVFAGAAASMTAASCSVPDPLRMESDLNMNGTISLEGPITMNMKMEGPSMKYDGTFISQELYDAVEVKNTRAEWALAAFGEPDSRSQTAEGGEYWVWRYRAASVNLSPVKIMNVGGDDEEESPPSMTVVLEIVNGTVIRKWRG